jgi:hypothetical protein
LLIYNQGEVPMLQRIFLFLFILVTHSAAHADEFALPSGDAVIRAPAGESEIVITTTARLAGAIHSLTWNGKEFIDSADHGRQLQSASNFDAGSPITAETFNPTEAGSRRDGRGPTSTSRLLHLVTTDHALQTTTQMAFWLAPGERSGPNLAKNEAPLSNHLLAKRVKIGHGQMAQVIEYDVSFRVPIGERHALAVFEALTGYMPAEFEKFWKYNPQLAELEPLSDGPGEQEHPVALATADGRYAMGIYTPQKADSHPDLYSIAYGRFRFPAEKVVKWNCVFRFANQTHGIAPGDYAFPLRVIVGDLETVRSLLEQLHEEDN